MKIIVHLSSDTEITLSVGSAETSWSWPMLSQYFIVTSLVEHSQLMKLLNSLISVNDDDEEQQPTAYRFRHGEGYSTVIYPTWAGCTTKNRGGDTNQQLVQANIVLKPRDDTDAAAASAFERWSAMMYQQQPTSHTMMPTTSTTTKKKRLLHVDLTIEKIGPANDLPTKFGKGFCYTMSQCPRPYSDKYTTILYIEESNIYPGQIDAFHSEKFFNDLSSAAAPPIATDAVILAAASGASDVSSYIKPAKSAAKRKSGTNGAKMEEEGSAKKTPKKAALPDKAIATANDIAEMAKDLVAASAQKKADESSNVNTNSKSTKMKSPTKKKKMNVAEDVDAGEMKVTDDEKGKGLKRPLNAFRIYSAEVKKELMEKNPECTPKEIVKKVGEEWKSLDNDAKRPWQMKADEAMTKFKEEYGEDALLSLAKKKDNETQTVKKSKTPDDVADDKIAVATTKKSAAKKVNKSTSAVDKSEGERKIVSANKGSTINKPVSTSMSIAEEAKALVAATLLEKANQASKESLNKNLDTSFDIAEQAKALVDEMAAERAESNGSKSSFNENKSLESVSASPRNSPSSNAIDIIFAASNTSTKKDKKKSRKKSKRDSLELEEEDGGRSKKKSKKESKKSKKRMSDSNN